MNDKICQAKTSKNGPCKNTAVNGFQFCHIHIEERKNSSIDENEALMCPYCEEPLNEDAAICSFCKLDLTPGVPVPPEKLTRIEHHSTIQQPQVYVKGSVKEDMGLGCGIFIVLLFLVIITGVFYVIAYLAGS